jgi:L-histidine N-alpha-methyltransferase
MRKATSTPRRVMERRPERAPASAFLQDVLDGLSRRPRALPSQYFYDARGSQLFQWITNLPGYYLTRVERELLAERGDEVVAPVRGRPCTVVDLGAGDGHKTRLLLERLAGRGPRVTYAPVDVSRAALDEACARAAAGLSGVVARPLLATWAEALRALPAIPGPKLVLFLGSSIGNLEHEAQAAFLRDLRGALGRDPDDHVLVGLDLVKPLRLLRAAYDDPQGVTRAFNLNLLARMNRELGASFDLGAFRHVATWDPARPAMESWLEATRAQEVRVGPRLFRLEAGERLHTEISCKYTPAQLDLLPRAAGFREVARFTDRRGWFVDALWRAGA